MTAAHRAARNRLAIVTGTTSGIGESTARRLLERGWAVLGAARRSATIAHEAYEHLAVDLRDVDAVVALQPRLTTRLVGAPWARVALVNNAADPALLGTVVDLDPRRLRDVFAANVASPIWLMGVIVRLTSSHAALRIVNVSTGAAVRAFPGLAAYGSSKAALRMAGMVLAAEIQSTADDVLRRRDIAILSYEPGAVDTPMQQLARAQPADVLPSVELFRRFETERILVSPERPAREIVRFAESDPAEVFQEGRLDA